MDKFVCVRVVRLQGIDLAQFQFDGDLSWAGFFLNADGTVYGRYGTKVQSNDERKVFTAKGLAKALERALDLHKGYPENKTLLAAKRGPAPEWADFEKMPALGKGFQRYGCIHCHHVNSGPRESYPIKKKPVPERAIWVYPPPEAIGLEIDADEGNRVAKVIPGSAAEKAGIKAGDVIETLEGQSILSLADIQFALHFSPDAGEIAFKLKRGTEAPAAKVILAEGWRRHPSSSTRPPSYRRSARFP